MSEKKVYKENVALISEIKEKTPELIGIRSGVEGLDELFFTTHLDKSGKPVVKPLNGYPFRSVINITGVPDTGKSLMVEQFTVKQASMGYGVCFVTVEQPAQFLVSGLKQRAMAMGVEFEKIEDKIVVIDAASNPLLRDDVSSFTGTLGYVIKKYNVKSTVIDSVTGLYEAKEMLARQIVRYVYNFLKKWNQTALLVSHKRSGHEALTSEAAGGYAVGHIVDGTIVISKKEIMSRFDQSMYGKPIGEMIRLFRIDGCRMCGHETDVRILEITQAGLVKIGPKLKDYVKEVKEGRNDD